MNKVKNPKQYRPRHSELKYHRITAIVPEDFCAEIKEYAAKRGMTISTLIETSLRMTMK